jgi:hypothetical protein
MVRLDARVRRSRRRAVSKLVLVASLVGLSAQVSAGGAFVSESSSFGPDTITYDPTTGLRWLDLTESAGYSHTQIVAELLPGGVFDGYHLATMAQVSKLFTDADIDLSVNGNFVPQNYAPVVALMALVGTLGNDGNCGVGCTFSYNAGYTDDPPPSQSQFADQGLAWFDNSAGVAPSYPHGLLGRAILGGGFGDSASAGNGAWLLVPEPHAALAGAAAALSLAALRVRRR